MIKYLIFLITAFYTNSIDAAVPECSILNLIPFSQWSGDSLKRAEFLKTPVALVVIQHTVSPTCDTDDACKKIVLDIRERHMKELNFTDVGNSFYIGGNGALYEGAGWRHKGAHTLGYNDKSIGISFIGDFSNKEPTAEALQAAQDLIACGVTNNYLANDYGLVGHRQLRPTLSPGEALQRIIQTWPHWTKAV